MNARVLALLAILFALLLAGCSFRAEGDSNDDDDGSDGGVSVGGDGDDDDNDSPSASVGALVSVLGVALLARRKLMG
ncbi:MAG TPA: hypothetical protein VM327_07735 [Candidatus Thermoplasmatota archaeon]|nr:hypothetical protein [Candidatus Thermoplasmatota archaeon]